MAASRGETRSHRRRLRGGAALLVLAAALAPRLIGKSGSVRLGAAGVDKESLLARKSTPRAPAAVHGCTHGYPCSYGQQGGRLTAALIRCRRNVPHSISPLFGTLRPSPRRAIRSGAVALGQMQLREQPRRLERLARALAASLIVVCVAVAVGCGASDEAAPNTSSPRVAQPSEDVTPAPTSEAARSSASAVEAQTTAVPRETPTPTPPAATPSPESVTAAPDPAPNPTSTAAPVKTEPPVPPKEAPPDGTEGRSSLGPRTRRRRGFRLAAEGEPPHPTPGSRRSRGAWHRVKERCSPGATVSRRGRCGS